MRVTGPAALSASTRMTWRPLRAVMAARLAATWPLAPSEPVPTTTIERAGCGPRVAEGDLGDDEPIGGRRRRIRGAGR